MSRNLEQEMDELKKQVTEIEILLAGRPVQTEPQSHAEEARTGSVAYSGTFASGGQQSSWTQDGISTDELLRLIENHMAEKVLRCIGSNDRLNLLLALLKEPMTVAALVEHCGYNSTGQVYHHLKPLIAADLVRENRSAAKGSYVVPPHRVQGIIMLLAGIHDMVSMEYAKGNWEMSALVHSGATMVDELYLATAEETQKTIETLFASMRPLVLKRFPPKEKKKLVILRLIAEQFETGKRYTEKEVNQILKSIYEADYVTIRRYLIEYGFMARTQDCRAYWLTGEEGSGNLI